MRDPFLSVYGHVAVDQIIAVRRFPADNTSEDVLSKATSLGGTGTNIAVTAARLGCPTAICGFVGDDFPAMYEDQMRESGLLMDELVRVDGFDTSTAVVVNDPGLTQKVLFYQGPQGSARETGVMLCGNASRSKHTHFSTGQPSYYMDVMERIRGRTLISLDPAQESHRIWTAESFPAALSMSDYLFCNRLEGESLAGYLGIGDILDAPAELVVRTDGSEGSVARIGDETVHVPLVPARRVADATGAGDSYRGGFYAALYHGRDIPEALVIASAVASFAVEETGALTNIPTWDSAVERAEPYMGMVG